MVLLIGSDEGRVEWGFRGTSEEVGVRIRSLTTSFQPGFAVTTKQRNCRIMPIFDRNRRNTNRAPRPGRFLDFFSVEQILQFSG